jgi:hypothetical protein
VLLVEGPAPYLLHIEFQSWRDPMLPRRLLWYNALIDYKHQIPVQTVAVLLRREADVPSIDGHLTLTQPDGRDYLDFRCLVVRVWELPVESLLTGPLGTVPLALVSDVPEDRLSDVLRRVGERINAEVDRPEAERLLVATEILTGMRLTRSEVQKLFQEAFRMSLPHWAEASSVVQDWIAQGRARGVASARHLLLKFGTAVIGPPAPEIVEAVNRIDDLDRIEALSDRLPSAGSWEALLAEPGPAAEPQR